MPLTNPVFESLFPVILAVVTVLVAYGMLVFVSAQYKFRPAFGGVLAMSALGTGVYVAEIRWGTHGTTKLLATELIYGFGIALQALLGWRVVRGPSGQGLHPGQAALVGIMGYFLFAIVILAIVLLFDITGIGQ